MRAGRADGALLIGAGAAIEGASIGFVAGDTTASLQPASAMKNSNALTGVLLGPGMETPAVRADARRVLHRTVASCFDFYFVARDPTALRASLVIRLI